MRLSRTPCLSCLLSWSKTAFVYLLISFKCFSPQQLSSILKLLFFSLIIWVFLMVTYGSILHLVLSLAHSKFYIPTSISLPKFMVSSPPKITFIHTLEKPPLTNQVHVVPATQSRTALEKGHLWEACQIRTWGESEPRQNQNQTNGKKNPQNQGKKSLDLLLPWRFMESFLYITISSTVGLSYLFELYRQSWVWGGFVTGSCAISSTWQE